jgi:hypothetical protein
MRVFLISVLAVLIIARVSLPYVIKHEANVRLSSIPDYKAHLDDVSLALWRGTFVFKGIKFIHKAGDMSLKVPRLNLHIFWPALMRHRLYVNAEVTSPRMRMLAQKPTEAAKKTGEKVKKAKQGVEKKAGKSLPDVLANAFPFRVNRFSIHNGSIRFREAGPSNNEEAADDQAKQDDEAGEKETALEARITDLELDVTNLTNIRGSSETAKATCVATAKVMGAQDARVDLQLDPIAKSPRFNMKFKLEQLPMVELNPIFEWQWGIRTKGGTFALYSEAEAKEGQFNGYVRPYIKDLKIDNKKNGNPVQAIKETAAKVVASVLKNTDTKAIATNVPFKGQFENPDVGIWEAVVEVLRNAFVQALRPSFDPSFKGT